MAELFSRQVPQNANVCAQLVRCNRWPLHVFLRFLTVVLPALALLRALPVASMPEAQIVVSDAGKGYPCDESGLANALADAVYGTTISFQCGAGRTSFNLSSEKAILRGLTVDGWNGGSRIVLDANDNSRIFTVIGSDFVNLRNLIFIHGRAGPYGGAVENYANLYISDCVFTDNAATDNGGAVNNHGYVSIQRSFFYSNTAGLLGGAFASGSDAAVAGSTFENNSVTSGQGGAVLNYGRMTVSDSRFSGNRAAYGSAMYSANWFALDNSVAIDNGSGADTVFAGGGVGNSGYMSIDQSTIAANASLQGGGVHNAGTLTIRNSRISENSSRDYGAGIFNATTGNLTIMRTTIANNRLATGTGIANFGRLTLNTSTLSGNSGAGAAVHSESPNVNISNSTLFSNTAPSGDSGNLHYAFGQSILLANTIVAGGLPVNCNLPQTSIGNNLEDTNTCGFNAQGDLHGDALKLDPLLGPLRDNGGPTVTHALLLGSPAIDKGFYCLSTDQRGVARPIDGDNDGIATCDIGAVEFNFTHLNWLPLVTR